MPIYKTTVDRCQAEARRFLERVEQFKGAKPYGGVNIVSCDYCGGPSAAAMKRASMDLSRALADLRQGRE